MRIIHCADLHLDSRMTKNLTKDKARERRIEILQTFTNMVRYAQDNDVRVIMIAGDLFDTRNVSVTAKDIVRDAIITHPDIDFLYLKGNHDNDNFLEKLEEIPDNLKLFDDDWRVYRYGDVVISGIELSKKNTAIVYNSLVLKREDYNIVMMHGQDSEYGAKDDAEVIDISSLSNKNIDYLALGHIHSYREARIDPRGTYCYSGCLEGRGFDECGEKGFLLLDIDENNHKMKKSFVNIASRSLILVPVDVTGCSTTAQVLSRIQAVIAKSGISNRSLVKIVLKGSIELEADLQLQYLQKSFEESFYYVNVSDETVTKVNYSDYSKDQSLKGEFIRMVEQSDLPEEKKGKIIRCGLSALLGEEIL